MDLADKFSPTIFTHLTTQDKSVLSSTRWKWEEPSKQGMGPAYSRSHIWANRREWKRLGSGAEGDAFTYNGTVIKVYKSGRFPFRNCLPGAEPELRWPTEIGASLLLGGMVGGQVERDENFLPVTDYFLPPQNEGGPPRWHFVTPFLPSGDLGKLAKHLRRSERVYTAHDLDALFRPSMERLLDGLDRMHNRYELCHDDIKPDNIFLSSTKPLSEGTDGMKNWILADLGNVREPTHIYHSSTRWSRANNLPDCRVNDVLRLVKTYLLFLRGAVDDVAAFDRQFFEGNEPWARLLWSVADKIHRREFVSAVSVQTLSKTLDPSLEECDALPHGRYPPGLWNPFKRLFMSRQFVVAQGVSHELRVSTPDKVARIWGMTWLFGVPVGSCGCE
ncbi:hypothetical protein ACJ41O_003162 [Fusarium nematophilum]